MKKRFLFAAILSLLSLLSFSSPLLSDEGERVSWVLTDKYEGAYPEQYQKLKWAIPGLMRQTVIDLSVRLGMQFQEGWQYPLIIGFQDGSPVGTENILAYVQLASDANGIKQFLVVNLEAYSKQNFNFEKVFSHELVHAMMNDAIGADASVVLPVWFHEGAAVYGADQGKDMVRSYVQTTYGFEESMLLNGLDSEPHGAFDYAEDYLAFDYIYTKHGSNSLHSFIREVVSRKGDIPGAISASCNKSMDQFNENFRAYAEDYLKHIAPPRKGHDTQAY